MLPDVVKSARCKPLQVLGGGALPNAGGRGRSRSGRGAADPQPAKSVPAAAWSKGADVRPLIAHHFNHLPTAIPCCSNISMHCQPESINCVRSANALIVVMVSGGTNRVIASPSPQPLHLHILCLSRRLMFAAQYSTFSDHHGPSSWVICVGEHRRRAAGRHGAAAGVHDGLRQPLRAPRPTAGALWHCSGRLKTHHGAGLTETPVLVLPCSSSWPEMRCMKPPCSPSRSQSQRVSLSAN